MAALTAARFTESRGDTKARRYKMANSTQVYRGGLVMLNSAGLATPAAAAAANQGVVGVAAESKLSGTGGTDWITVHEGTFLMGATSIADTSVGLACYASDDQTVDETQGANEPRAGILVEVVSSTSGWVAVGIGLHS